MFEQNLLILLLLLPFVAAFFAATLPRGARSAAAWLSGLACTLGLLLLVPLYELTEAGGVVIRHLRWVPALELNLTLRMDGFVWLFLALIYGIGVLVVLYARYYLSAEDPVPRFYSLLMAFAGAMVGIVLSGNVMMMLVFWELTSVFSFLLIGYWYQLPAAREGARTSLIITAAGGLCLMVALILMGQIAGSYELERILASGTEVRAHRLYPLILTLLLLGAFSKSAQVPLHVWLPGAMAAPTPVSAYLHSATMVKAGIFLLIRFSPVLGGTNLWFQAVAGIGILTMLFGAVVALFRHDLKGLLAYSTISHLGLIVTLTGIGSPAATVAAIFHLANHALFKASLFMAAGIVDHECGTRDIRRLSGLWRVMPRTAGLAIVAAAAMAGVPLLNGFISKEMFFAETVALNNPLPLDRALPWLAVTASLFSVAYSLRFVKSVFFGPLATDLPRTPHEPPALMRRPAEVLVVLCLLVGIFPAATLGPLLASAAQAVLGPELPQYSLAVWHGFSLPFRMSLVAMGGGAALYLTFARAIETGPEGPPLLWRIRGQRVFERVMLRLAWTGPRLAHRWLGTESLQPQMLALVLAVLAAAAVTVLGRPIMAGGLYPSPPQFGFALMWLVGGACAVGAAVLAKYHRFAALVALGGVGLVTCLTFAQFSAPDLAVTQLLVEIVTTVLMLLGLRWLPKRQALFADDRALRVRIRRARDLVLALGCGAGLAVLAFAVMTAPQGRTIGDWFLAHALSEGGGTNAVNVILVDFRGFDTFGEITVLGIVSITVFALLRRFRPAPESHRQPKQQGGAAPDPESQLMLVPAVLMQWMFPVIILAAAWLFFRGHELPGGGFAAGVTLAIGFLLQYIASNVRKVEAQLTVLPVRWMGAGLLIAAGTGIGAFLFDQPFLSAHAGYLSLPLIGEVPVVTATLFDLGVFALVVGAVVLILIAIAHQSLRSARAREAAAEAEQAAEDAQADPEAGGGASGGGGAGAAGSTATVAPAPQSGDVRLLAARPDDAGSEAGAAAAAEPRSAPSGEGAAAATRPPRGQPGNARPAEAPSAGAQPDETRPAVPNPGGDPPEPAGSA